MTGVDAEAELLARLPRGTSLGQTRFAVQWRRCGKKCRCATEEGPRHGPYLYAYIEHLGTPIYLGRVREGDPIVRVLHQLAGGDLVCVSCAPKSLVRLEFEGPGPCAFCSANSLLRVRTGDAPTPDTAELRAWLRRIRESATSKP